MASPYLGEIRLFAGLFEPSDWAFCDGRLLQINQYQALFSLLGTQYGGDGTTTFGIPDLRGRLPIGMGTATSGTSAYALGQIGGATTVTLTADQIPAHNHPLVAYTSPATAPTPVGNVLADPDDQFNFYTNYSTANSTRVMASNAITPTGGGQSHTNMMPSLPLNYMICLMGIYPDSN